MGEENKNQIECKNGNCALFEIKGIIKKGKYLYALVPEHPNATKNGYVLLHRVVMENYIGRLLNKNEVVHHINYNTFDCRIQNLKLMSKEEHDSLHALEQKRLYAIIKCENCGSIFIREANKVIYKTNSTGMNFCSKECYKIYISQKGIIQRCEEDNKSSIIDIGYLSKDEYLDRLENNDYSPIENHSKETSGIQKEILVDEEIKQMIKYNSKSKKICKCCGRILKNNSDLCIECYRRQQNKIVVDKIVENQDKIANMALERKTVKEISESLGLIPQSFSRACRRLGIKYKI